MKTTVLLSTLVAACSSGGGTRIYASQMVGPEGAHLQGDGVALDIPAGALSTPQQITISASSANPAPGLTPFAPVFHLEPSGLVFASPVTLSIDVPPSANGVALWSMLGDDTSFEFSGFAENGLAIAIDTHFSDVGAVPNCDDPDHDAMHSEGEPGDEACDVSPMDAGMPDAGSPMMSNQCLRLCNCMAPEAQGGAALCPTDQGRGTGPNCPGNTQWVTGDSPVSNRFVAEGGNLACNGYRYGPVRANLCECDGVRPGGTSPEPLCARAWVNSATPPFQSWGCTTTASGTAPDGQAYTPSDPMLPVHPGYGITAFIGAEGMACTGYLQPASTSESPMQVSGHMSGCAMQDIDTKWEPISGTTAACSMTDDDFVRCRLTAAEWQELQARRMACDFPPRTRYGERDAGPFDERNRQMLITTAVFYSSGVGEIAGYSSRAQRNLDARRAAGTVGPMCPMQAAVMNDWAMQVGGTTLHAEGGALVRAAEAAGRSPMMSGMVTPGSFANMVVDRRPCHLFCRRGGIDAARRAAGIETLQVRSPGGCLLFTQTAPNGAPCPPAP